MELLRVQEDDFTKVLKYYKTDRKRIEQDLRLITDWYKKQAHLPQDVKNEGLFERVLIGCKFRVEVAKDKIDRYYTVKTVFRDVYSGLELLRPTQIVATYMPLPHLTPTGERLVLIKVRKLDFSLNFENFMKLVVAIGELCLHFDYSVGVRSVCDFGNVKLEHILKVNPGLLQRITAASQDALAARILGLECFNTPSIIPRLMTILKAVMKPKLFQRIKFHNDLESLYKTVPKELLPMDYGGELPNSEELLRQWDTEFENKKEFFADVLRHGSNEKLRVGKSKYGNESFGVEGSFRKLEVD